MTVTTWSGPEPVADSFAPQRVSLTHRIRAVGVPLARRFVIEYEPAATRTVVPGAARLSALSNVQGAPTVQELALEPVGATYRVLPAGAVGGGVGVGEGADCQDGLGEGKGEGLAGGPSDGLGEGEGSTTLKTCPVALE